MGDGSAVPVPVLHTVTTAAAPSHLIVSGTRFGTPGAIRHPIGSAVPANVDPGSLPTNRIGPGQPLGAMNCTLLEADQKSNECGPLDKLNVKTPPEHSGKT